MNSNVFEMALFKRAETILKQRASLAEWCISCGYVPAQHHRLIIEHLEALERGEIRRLMIAMPPGSAKSTYGSVLFAPWYLARNPLHSLLAASHSEELAERWGRRVRDIVISRANDLGIAVSQGNRAAARWQLAPNHRHRNPLLMGEYMTAGSNSAIAGFRGDLGLIDDPVKSREEISSETQRQRLWEWYIFDYRPRLKPGAKQVFIGTRWHEDDLAGRILAESGHEWVQLTLPMLAEHNDILGRKAGDLLWPEWFTLEMAEEAMRDPVVWLSLYQQRPTHEEGTYWKREWLHPVDPAHVPPLNTLRIYGASDYATKANAGDFTVHTAVGLDPEDRPWLLEIWRAQTTSDVWVGEWCGMVKHWKPLRWAEEHGQILSGVGPFLEREAHKQHAYTERLQFVSRLDKGMRAQSMRGFVASRGLWYASDLPGRAELEAELIAFPNGRNDDIHDSLGLVGQLLDLAVHGQHPKKVAPKPKPGYKNMREKVDMSTVI